MKFLINLIFLFGFCHAVQSANILALFSSLSFPDHLVYRSYISLLAERGHSIVMMTPYPGGVEDHHAIREIDVGVESIPFWEKYTKMMANVDDYYSKIRSIHEFSIKLASAQLGSKKMQDLFKDSKQHFDLVITEAEVPMLFAVAEKYGVPHIAITASTGSVTMFESKGNPNHPLLYPDIHTQNYRNLTLWQKYTEIMRYVQFKSEYYGEYLPNSQKAVESIVSLKRDLLNVEYDIDLLLVTGKPFLTGNRPTVPAVIHIDDLHLNQELVLPHDLTKVLDAAKNGAVFFSLGSIHEPEYLPDHVMKALNGAFSELPYTVLWKIGNSTYVNKSKKIVTRSWFPQQEVLSHRNVKAFITHGGPRSLEEAIFHNVPIIGMPISKSREVFMKEITRHGAGEVLDLQYLDKNILKDTITRVVTQERYKTKMSLVKTLSEDSTLTGKEKAVWWTEYVIRHRGAKHLKSPFVGISLYQYFLIDIFLFITTVFLLIVFLVYLSLYSIFKRYGKKKGGSKYKSS